MKEKTEITHWLTDDTLDVGKEPLEVTESDECIRKSLAERIENGEFNLDDRPIDERIAEFEKEHGRLPALTEEELKQYGL